MSALPPAEAAGLGASSASAMFPPPGRRGDAALLALPHHSFPIRVYFEDTDAGGMAYHATYLRWAERARTEALRDIDLPHSDMIARHNSILVVRRIGVEYALPARLDDSLAVETRVLAVKGVTLGLDQRMRRGEDTLAVLAVELACVDKDTLRPKRIPEPWRSALAGAAFGARDG